MNPAIAIAGVRGGSGKTITAVGLCRALKNRGMDVCPVKKGPDYIDPAWLGLAAGRSCRNLDTYLLAPSVIAHAFCEINRKSDITVLEGNRGLFDGYDAVGTHSLAALVKFLGIPVVLVVDCSKASRTIAALVLGCLRFDRGVPVKGVILNRVAGERHRGVITAAIEHYCGIPVLGAIPRLQHLDLPERHLGLLPTHEYRTPEKLAADMGRAVSEHVDIDGILSIARRHLPRRHIARRMQESLPSILRRSRNHGDAVAALSNNDAKRPTIGVIMDTAFNFYYPENIEALRSRSDGIVMIDSMSGVALPAVDGLYIGGGFPETHARALGANTAFIQSLRDRIMGGMPVYAECGGLIYLSDSIIAGGERFPMAGIFPFVFELSKRPEAHGYTEFMVETDNPFYRNGTCVRGHEFRYSRLVNPEVVRDVRTVFSMKRGTGIACGRDGALFKNTLATFSHTHTLTANADWAEGLASTALRMKVE